MISMTPRKHISLQRTLVTPVVSIMMTLCVGAAIFAILGYDPLAALYQFFIAPLSRPDQVADLFVKACPLIITATGLVFCYRANVWNIGAEGQIVMGAVCAGGVALFVPGLPDILLMPTMILAAMVGGMAWALIPGILKARFNTNEILVSLMLTYVAALFIDWLVRGPWRDPQSFGFPLTKSYDEAALIQRVDLPGIGTLGQLHWGVVAALVLALVAYFVMSRTLFGFQVKVMGDAPRAGAFSGFCAARTTIGVLCISGACAGVAGMVEVSANMGQLQPEVSFGYGFTAIIVAFLARLNPLGVIAAGLVIALAELGGDSAQMALGMPKVVTGVFKGILLFMLLAGETFNRFQLRISWPALSRAPAARGR
ncbi:MAG: ABC transporter permease [Proteobacteria bacterium]|nr:ABC transporter permease [Pseudomonadota bacterium]MDA0845988.1 ABC transporter permease [Pseudomonadota bacterium]